MSVSGRIETKNKLLSVMPVQDASLLAPLLEPMALKQGDVLFEKFSPISHVYFLESGLSSEIAVNADNDRKEVGCVGSEGFSGVPVVLGVDDTPHRAFMQTDGTALRIRSTDLQQAMETNRSLRRLILRFTHVFMIQVAATALADARYNVEQRLARWLLMSSDRLGQELPLTHDFLSLMLGVRRPSVTDGLHILEGKRMIKATRNLIAIQNRADMEQIAGSAYGVPEAEYRRLIGDPC